MHAGYDTNKTDTIAAGGIVALLRLALPLSLRL